MWLGLRAQAILGGAAIDALQADCFVAVGFSRGISFQSMVVLVVHNSYFWLANCPAHGFFWGDGQFQRQNVQQEIGTKGYVWSSFLNFICGEID